jgi:hypothetical protein
MPLKTVGAGGRKPMKTALISSSAPNHGNVNVDKVAADAAALVAGATAETAAETNILDKISRDCSSEELKYLSGLSILEQKVCLIAQDHLESSFDLERSSGFIAWKNNNS